MKYLATVYVLDPTIEAGWAKYEIETDIPPPHAGAYNMHDAIRYIETLWPDLKDKPVIWKDFHVTADYGKAPPRRLH